MALNNMKLDWHCDSNEGNHKYDSKNMKSDMASSLIRETTAFEIQTRDICVPPATELSLRAVTQNTRYSWVHLMLQVIKVQS